MNKRGLEPDGATVACLITAHSAKAAAGVPIAFKLLQHALTLSEAHVATLMRQGLGCARQYRKRALCWLIDAVGTSTRVLHSSHGVLVV